MTTSTPQINDSELIPDVSRLITDAKQHAAQQLNAELTQLYWRVGQRISRSVLGGERGGYGKEVIAGLSKELIVEHGRGWGTKQLRHCLRFFEVFPDESIVYALRRQLSWTHLRTLAYIENELKRTFYTQMAAQERWSTRVLNDRIDSQLFERTALSRKPEETVRLELAALQTQGVVTEGLVLKDPYVLDFLELNDTYLEKDLEDAILREHEQQPQEEPPLGIILCAGKKHEQIELLELDAAGIHVAEYLTELPPLEVLQQRLQDAVLGARARLEARGSEETS